MTRVELLIYDLSGGLAGSLTPLLGIPIEGIWHTAIVCFQREWFFGSSGIESLAPPGSMEIGSPVKTLSLGTCSLSEEEYLEVLDGLSRGKFKRGSYDLFHHNCNNFSQELAQILCGTDIPKYILDLPKKVLESHIGQVWGSFAKSLQEPRGRPLHSSKVIPKTVYQAFDSPIDACLFLKKLTSLCEKNSTPIVQGLEHYIKSFLSGNTSNFFNYVWPFFCSNLEIWPPEDLIPFFDAIRYALTLTELNSQAVRQIHLKSLNLMKTTAPENPLIFRVVLRVWSNYFLQNNSRELVLKEREAIFEAVNGAVESSQGVMNSHIQTGLTSLCLNYAVTLFKNPDGEGAIQVVYALVHHYFPNLNYSKASTAGVIALGTIILKDSESKDLALSLEACTEISRIRSRCEDDDLTKAIEECLKILQP